MALLHLDSAAAARPAPATLAATHAFLEREVEVGAYVAQDDLGPQLDELRAALGRLTGFKSAEVGLVHGAGDGLARLLAAWRWPAGARVGLALSGWGPSRVVLRHAGLEPVDLPCEADGRIDVDALQRLVERGAVDLVHLDQAAAHRGLRQPVAEAAAVCRGGGVPLWLDLAQAAGVFPGVRVDAAYGTSRKWLAGPRGVGFLAVAREAWLHLDPARLFEPVSPLAALEPGECSVAARAGFAVAVAAHEPHASSVRARLAEVGEQVRSAVAGVSGWEVVPGQHGPITALRPTAGQDVVAVRRDLLAGHQVLTTASLPWRAPGEMTEAWLRVSPHTDLSEVDLERLCGALHSCR